MQAHRQRLYAGDKITSLAWWLEERSVVAGNARQDAGVCHHLDGFRYLFGEALGELLVGHPGQVREVLAVDVVEQPDSLGVPPEDEVAGGVLERVAAAILLDLDLTGQIVELVQVGHVGDGHVLEQVGTATRLDDLVGHLGCGVAGTRVGVAVGGVADDDEAVDLLGLSHHVRQRLAHGGVAPGGGDQLGDVLVVVARDDDRVVGPAVGEDHDPAGRAEVQCGTEVPDEDLQQRPPLVPNGSGVVEHDHDLAPEARQAGRLQRRRHGVVALAEADVLGAVVLAEADRGAAVPHVGERDRSDEPLRSRVDAVRCDELGSGCLLFEHD